MKNEEKIKKNALFICLNPFIFCFFLLIVISMVLPGSGLAGGPNKSVDPATPGKPSSGNKFSSEQILVKFKKPFSQGVKDLKKNIRSQAAVGLENNLAGFGVKFSKHFGATGISVLKVTDKSGHLRKDIIMRLNKSGLVEYAEPDWVVHTTSHQQAVPNDIKFNELWGMHNTGQTGGTIDADIDAPEAWSVRTTV